jgi:hypothetical protein
MKPCACGGDMIYGFLGKHRVGYKCPSCGVIWQKKPRLPKGEIDRVNQALSESNRVRIEPHAD